MPTLPTVADELTGFVCDGWTLLDSAALDFDGDGNTDYVGVLDYDYDGRDDDTPWYPRVLFAVRGDGGWRYTLDFCEINLVRTRAEGGVFGDPYMPLTADGHAFTIHAYGGSAWKWEEASTFEYIGGEWYLTHDETYGSYGPIRTDAVINDYASGVGLRKLNRTDNVELLDPESETYALEYSVKLDRPITLSRASQRARGHDIGAAHTVERVVIADGIDLSPDEVQPIPGAALPATLAIRDSQPLTVSWYDEDCIIYTFWDLDRGYDYLAVYDKATRTISVILQTDVVSKYGDSWDTRYDFVGMERYDGKLYIERDELTPLMVRTYNGDVIESLETTAAELIRVNADGTGRETVFRFDADYDRSAQVQEGHLPYTALIIEPSGGEIAVQVYQSNAPHRFYRMNTDGSDCVFIGELAKLGGN
jgi:hypothetical protein